MKSLLLTTFITLFFGCFFGGTQISNTLGGYSCASISNANGQLLFYSDGERVWDKNNQLMPNGFGLSGGDASINTVLIIPLLL